MLIDTIITGAISPIANTLQSDGTIILHKKVKVTTFGETYILNGKDKIPLSAGTYTFDFTQPQALVVPAKAGVYFHTSAQFKEVPENIPVPDLPDYKSDSQLQLEYMVDEILRRKGLSRADIEESDDYYDSYEDDDNIIPLDSHSRVIEETPTQDTVSDEVGETPDAPEDVPAAEQPEDEIAQG